MGKNILELLPYNFGDTVHLRTASVQAVGQLQFSFAAILRVFGQPGGNAIAVLGNSTDLAATNGWCLEVTTDTAVGGAVQTTLDFSCYFTTAGRVTASLVLPENYTTGNKPLCVIGTVDGSRNVRLWLDGQRGASASGGPNPFVAGLGRLCLGSMPSPALGNTLAVAVAAASYMDELVSGGTLTFTAKWMVETGEIPNAASLGGAPAWTHLYSVQRSSLARQTTLPMLATGAAPATLTALENLGTLGASGDLVPFGVAGGFIQSCPVNVGIV